ncbi:zinc-binding dehydrogenase [Staphylococcus pseudintermedius]|uniref:zinc-binding dehydrogenase n=1 Tax=Staphylococcus pseudintermedius TaxID=283734 RepID=UPI001440F3E7|nr:zinc-binding dehydrogenase [Staphylococcus pseudintermedius]NKM52445.1 zinc-binding dehydrogenase [Staphylococcus pseudintermedius]
MEAIIATQPFQLAEGQKFEKVSRELPTPEAHDILIKVYATGINPVDTKMRQAPLNAEARVLGFDAAGVVEAVGDAVTAYETLFDVFNISPNPQQNQGKTLFIINGAGGVGSIATQIAKTYGLTVVTTASRPETNAWSKKMGADVVLNHKEDLAKQFDDQNLSRPNYIFCTYDTDHYYDVMIDLVQPRGHIATIVAFNKNQDLNALKQKSITFTHEFMFARAIHGVDEGMYRKYLEDVTAKVDAGQYQTTLNSVLTGLTPENVLKAHEMMEAQSHIGKLVIEIVE